MRYAFHIVDVFSAAPYGGNQLAIIPEAEGLSDKAMQGIAREFNFAETTFVLPGKDDDTWRVRIFTPRAEVPFAGHPTIGTACALVLTGDRQAPRRLVLEEKAGAVPVDVELVDDVFYGTLTLPGNIEAPTGAPSPEVLAEVLSLTPADVVESFFASTGIPFCFARLVSNEAVDRAQIDKAAWKSQLRQAWSANVFVFAGELADGGKLYARMFAPALGVEEDPATGSACAALVGAAASRSDFRGDTFRLFIRQGEFMGRQSDIEAVARKEGEALASISVRGATAYVASGEIEAPGADGG